jgi:hypothetical protein
MKISRLLILFLGIVFFATCETYDNAIIYHRNFQPGKNSLLRFDGFYSDSTPAGSNEFNVPTELLKPIFFYSDGSAFATNNYNWLEGMDGIIKTNRLVGSWGNYLISGDTIQLEKFQLLDNNNHERITMKGIISKDQIRWMTRKDKNKKTDSVNYSIYFRAYSTKPDSTKNFTRTMGKYNKVPVQ